MAPAPEAGPGPADADRSRRLYVGPWRIDLTRRGATPKVLTDRSIARTAAAALDVAAQRFAPASGASLTIVLTDDAELAELNGEHLGKRGPTDVLSSMQGSYVPLARTAPDRKRVNDPRLSIDERYRDKDQYVGQVTKAGLDLIDQGYLLAEDLAAIVRNAGKHWDYAIAAAPATTQQRQP